MTDQQIQKLKTLKTLLDEKILTQEEFDQQKQSILAGMFAPQTNTLSTSTQTVPPTQPTATTPTKAKKRSNLVKNITFNSIFAALMITALVLMCFTTITVRISSSSPYNVYYVAIRVLSLGEGRTILTASIIFLMAITIMIYALSAIFDQKKLRTTGLILTIFIDMLTICALVTNAFTSELWSFDFFAFFSAIILVIITVLWIVYLKSLKQPK